LFSQLNVQVLHKPISFYDVAATIEKILVSNDRHDEFNKSFHF